MKEADIKALIEDAEEIRDETETGANTATRVGTVLVSLAEGLTPDESQTEGNYLPLTGGVLTGPLYFQTEGATVAYIDAGTGSFASVVTVDLTARGNAKVDYLISDSGLTVTEGDTTINDTLTVAGMTTLNGGLTLNSDLTIGRNYKLLFGTSGDLYITADGEASLSTVVATTATIGGATTINGTLTVGREGAFNGNTVVYGTLTVDDDLTVRGDNLTVEYNLKVNGETTLEKATTINDTLTVASYVYGSNFYATSDERKKSDIQRITDEAVERASKVEAREYDLDGRRFGYVAQDVRRVLPSLVSEGEDGYLSLDYLSLLTLKNEALERRVQTLENQISALAARLEKLEGRDA